MFKKLRIGYYRNITEGLARLLKTPPYIIFFVSDICPNRCLHCWYNDDWKEENIRNKILSFNEIEKISRKIKYIHFLTLTGGEAFLRKEIVEIVNVFNRNTKLQRCDIPTSGFNSDMISEKVIKILEENKNLPFRVDVSIDGTVDTHDHIRNHHGLFDEALKTINNLKKVKSKYSNFDLSIISTISEHNNKEIGKIADLIETILPDGEWMVNIERPPSKIPDVANDNFIAYLKASEIIKKRIKNNRFKGDDAHYFGNLLTKKNIVRREIISAILEGKRQGGGCSAGSLIGVIFNDGEVRPCESLKKTFGNIRDYGYDLSAIWNNESAKIFRKKVQEEACLCTHECVWSTNMLIQPSCWMRMLNQYIK